MSESTIDPGNIEQARSWDGQAGEYWSRHAETLDASVARYHAALLEAGAIGASARVLDIGCGTGQSTRDAARRALSGAAFGVDRSAQMIALARELAHCDGIGNATFERADAQVYPFDAQAYDVAISRAGARFFGDPLAAFGNIARAVRPGGRLALLTGSRRMATNGSVRSRRPWPPAARCRYPRSADPGRSPSPTPTASTRCWATPGSSTSTSTAGANRCSSAAPPTRPSILSTAW
jgi:SAM-dependent methyltransferase